MSASPPRITVQPSPSCSTLRPAIGFFGLSKDEITLPQFAVVRTCGLDGHLGWKACVRCRTTDFQFAGNDARPRGSDRGCWGFLHLDALQPCRRSLEC